jgi:DNA polymerase
MTQVAAPADFAAFRGIARALLAAGVRPADVTWAHPDLGSLLDEPPLQADAPAPMPSVPRELVDALDAAACHRFDARWALMYRVLWRTVHDNRQLIRDGADPDVVSLRKMAAAVRHDVHRMHAYVRFRAVADDDPVSGETGERFVAWYEPEHLVLDRAAPFFAARFANMRWMIATPDGAIEWDPAAKALQRAPPPPPGSLPASDAREALWCTYFANVFNAARTNPDALARHLPKRWWKNLPEGREIERLLGDGYVARERLVAAAPVAADAGLRVRDDALPRPGRRWADGHAADGDAVDATRADVSDAAAAGADGASRAALDACRGCPLWERATQPVGGVGPRDARLMLVGEAPGDQEDLQGRPFVGPAGTVLDESLQDAGLARDGVYLTNAVKHFAWEPRGKRRLHRRPLPAEVGACNGWLLAELATVRPRVVVALGATALGALTGWKGSVKDARHEMLHLPSGARVVATWHPAAILRAPPDAAQRMRAELAGDLVRAAALAAEAEHGDADDDGDAAA